MGAWLMRCRLPSFRRASRGKVNIYGCCGCEYYEPRDMRCCRFYPYGSYLDVTYCPRRDKKEKHEDFQKESTCDLAR